MRNCLLVFLIIIFVLTLPVYFFIINFGQTLTPAFIKSEIKKTGVIEKISQELPSQLASSFSSGGEVNQQAIQSSIDQIPNSQIQSTLQSNFDSNLAALSNPNTKELVFDVSNITKSIPPELKSEIQLSGGPNQIQDKYTYEIPAQIRFYRFLINNLALIKTIGIALFGLLLVLIALSAKGWKTKFRAVSLSLLIPGLAIALPFFMIKFVPFSLPNMSGVPQVISDVANDLFKVVKVDIAGLYVWEGLGLVICAIVLFALSFLFSSSTNAPIKNDTPVSAPAPKPAKA